MLAVLYNLFIQLFSWVLPLVGSLSPKLKLFTEGRKSIYKSIIESEIQKNKVIWFHCASLGEYEQGVPIMESIKASHPEYKLVVTFFSPSGYEVKKNSTLADLIIYLPIDTRANAKRFIKIIEPEIAIFVKYEFWPNYIKELKANKIPLIIASAVFREEQSFFKWYGGFMKNVLKRVDYFFVQDRISKELLEKSGFDNSTISGDTRFDRVAKQIEMDNKVDFIERFIADRLCIAIGSSWPEDEQVFIDFVNNAPDNLCFIIAPHEIKQQKNQMLVSKLLAKTILFSEKENKKLETYQVFILDTIGYLSRVYSYADIAYVGGAMGTSGLHNILEPATFGIPIVIGQNFEKFREAKQLQKLAGLYTIKNSEEFSTSMNKLVGNTSFRQKTGMISGHFVNSNTGATAIITAYIKEKLDAKS